MTKHDETDPVMTDHHALVYGTWNFLIFRYFASKTHNEFTIRIPTNGIGMFIRPIRKLNSDKDLKLLICDISWAVNEKTFADSNRNFLETKKKGEKEEDQTCSTALGRAIHSYPLKASVPANTPFSSSRFRTRFDSAGARRAAPAVCTHQLLPSVATSGSCPFGIIKCLPFEKRPLPTL
ncbi:uncharacterized protein BCR38DRAFT_411682 [Pseudomassariella vexata]|uniref:Uncharacterized protein n=1 Tax=Pseudomassariella vexata TaxID=1141098 RepID=A0A1Y2DMP2_9PEZI|nr:uncharacterized protein BCR38DRAFT_411682 [Pseudomassariella vexata]ORY60532.1 hypothetical protein BCR38DRAFT_411682 [Pseudomassariella vexata]